MDMGEYIYEKFKNIKDREFNKDGIDCTLYNYYMTHGLGELGEDACIAGQLAHQHARIKQLEKKLRLIREILEGKND